MILVHDLVFWGAFGMIVETCFTAMRDLIRNKELSMMGHTSLWMFPVYAFGLSYGFDFIIRIIESDVARYLTYPLLIWTVELIIGIPAVSRGIRIWDYGYLPKCLHWRGIISFIHYPLWMVFGILVEIIK